MRGHAVVFGARVFPTQRAAKRYAAALVDGLPLGPWIRRSHPAAFADLLAVFRRHPDAERKLRDLADVRVVLDRGARKLVLRYADGRTDDISWNCCVAPRATNHALMTALRAAVQDQIAAFRAGLPATVVCPRCGVTTDAWHVDHVNKFRLLVQEFHWGTCADRGLAVPHAFDGTSRPGVGGFCAFADTDRPYAEAWREFHRTRARLRPLCPACNAAAR